MALFLTLLGFFLQTARNGQEALDVIAESGPPAVIVLDLMMPVMDGRTFGAALSRDEDLAVIPVTVGSSCAWNTDRTVPGAVAALVKPPAPDDLLALVARDARPGV